MDPNQAFLDMFDAMKNQEFETAREVAFALKAWLAKGGIYHYQYTPEVMHGYTASLLRRTSGSGPEPAFTLVCRECGAGMDIDSEEQAIEQDWSAIKPAFALPQANFCGMCLD
jgi:hypothetical protein